MSDLILLQATDQWSSRPADQRFASLEALHNAVTQYREASVEARSVSLKSLRVEAADPSSGEIQPTLVGKGGVPARFTNHGFGQFARRVGAPAAYLRTLSPKLVADNLNEGIAKAEDDESSTALLFARNGGLTVRSVLTDDYTRIWNSDVSSRLIRLTEQSPEWQPAPAAFDGSRGLYASDEDMFAFLVDNDRRIFEKGPGGGLGRGFFVSNSEVGKASFVLTTFLYEYICGNHRVWGAQGVAELRIPHVGKADAKAFSQMQVELRRYADASASDDEAKVSRAMAYELGKDKDEVLDRVFSLRGIDAPRKTIAKAYDLAVTREDWYGNPRTAWGLAGGMTEIARDLPNADERTKLDRAAGKLMQIAF